MAVCQAMDLIGTGDFSPFSRKIYEKVREFSSFVEDDRPLDEEIRKTADFLKNTDLF
jgi:histidine ammonia-lyase